MIKRRVLRLIKRVFLRSFNIIIVLVFAILFGLLITPIGFFINKYKVWYDAVWDLRSFFLTSVFIVLVNTNFIEEKRRKEGLQNQYYIYSSFLYETEKYIEELLNVIEFTWITKIFLTDKDIHDFKEILKKDKPEEFVINHHKYKEFSTYLISIHQKYLHELRGLLSFINSTENLEMHKENAIRWIRDTIISTEEEILLIENINDHYMPKHLTQYINENLSNYIYIIAELRRPWRWDHKRDMDIREKLFYKGVVIEGIDTVEYWLN